MRNLNFASMVSIGNRFIKEYLREGDLAIDCTVGNGYDTKILAEGVGTSGLVYGFDIQEDAIKNTRELLLKYKLEDRVRLFKDSHENIDKYIESYVDLVVYNLGYLPGSNKKIITEAKSTIKSIKKSLKLLRKNGIIIITSYIGHRGGAEENCEIEDLLSNLNQSYYNIIKSEFVNQKNCPPILYIIRKL